MIYGTAQIVVIVILLQSWQTEGALHTIPDQPLETTKQWTTLTYNFAWDAAQNDKDFYDPESVIATGIAVDYGRIFVSTPRLFSGVPATLSTIQRNNAGDSPVLEVRQNI